MTLEELRASLPAPWSEPGARRRIRERLMASGRRIAVVDDDPTGTQTVHGARVCLDLDPDSLAAAMRLSEPLFFVSTNSRSLDARAADLMGERAGRALAGAAALAGCPLSLVSRSDSTLRGHFPGELTALCRGAGLLPDAILLVPAFFEGGRYTAGDVHWVDQGGSLLPAARTEFARDPTFGFRHSDLSLWVEEKTGGAVKADDVHSVSLDDIRGGGPRRVAALLSGVPRGATVVINACRDEDLEAVVLGMADGEDAGRRYLCRTAASFVKVRAGLDDRPLLDTREIGGGVGPVLFVVGSYVEKTSRQLAALLSSGRVDGVEFHGEKGDPAGAARRVSAVLATGRHAVLYTSRVVSRGADFLAVGAHVMNGLCNAVALISERPAAIVAKGGITSMEIARTALGARDAVVAGQVLPGVPLWRLGATSRFPGAPYVVFPGNVGGDAALLDVLLQLRPE